MKYRARALTAIALICVAACSDSDQAPSTFAIATATTGGLYYPFGGAMASIWSQHLPEVNAKAEVTGGSVVNVIQVARKESEIGIALADTVTDAYLGNGRFGEPLPLRILVNAYPNVVHILTLRNNDVSSIADLRGKRVSLGAAGSGTAIIAANIVTGLGISLDEFAPAYLGFGETTSAIKDGTISAGFLEGGLGLSAVTELAVSRDLELVALSDDEILLLGAAFPAYTGYDIPADTYNGVDRNTQTLSAWSSVVVHESMPDVLAYKLVCTLFKHKSDLIKVSQVAKDMTIANLDAVPAVPLHPGTERYRQQMTQSSDPVGSGALDCRE